MPFYRAWLVLPSKRVQKQKIPNQLNSSISKVVLTRFFQQKNKKAVLNKSDSFCENTSERMFAYQLIYINIKTKIFRNNKHYSAKSLINGI